MKKYNTDNLFSPIRIPAVYSGSEEILSTLLQLVDRFAKCCNLSLYIIDYKLKTFNYVSENKLFLSGYSSEDVKEMGYSFYSKVVSGEDLLFLDEINRAGFKFYYEQPLAEREHYVIEYDFDLHHINNQVTRINHKLVPLCITEKGDIWLALCLVSMSSNKQEKTAIIKNIHTRNELVYSLKSGTWNARQARRLTHKELRILQLSAQGFTNVDISKSLVLNINTVKFHKRNIFEKLSVTNSLQAITVASQLGLL